MPPITVHFRAWGVCLLALLVLALATFPLRGAEPALPPAANGPVEFRKDILPILAGSCLKCHTGESAKGGLRLETRELLLKGGESGPVVKPGKSGESLLISLVAGHDKDRVMPAQGPRLSAEKIGLLRGWIDQDLPWEKGFAFKAQRIAPLAPRKVTLPATPPGSPPANPIDLLLAPYLKQHGVAGDKLVSDAVFARRVSLDLVGLLPSPEEIDRLAADTAPDKRQKYVRGLLDNREAYAAHWLTFWNDALRNAYRGTGFIDGGREQITRWLYDALVDNKPYDQFVRELISPPPGATGFTKGIVWRGVVNASQRPEMQAAQGVSQVFLGTNLKCASCHDSFVNQWKLHEAYALAAVFATAKLEIHRCDKPTGETAQAAFLYPELGAIDPQAPREARMQRLAELVTSPKNGRLARTQVNRLWAWCFGRGLVEPVDDLDQLPWQADVLDYLASDLVEHGYDLKRTLELITTSRAYQLPAVGAPKPDDAEYVFRGPLVKRMTAEQFIDAVSALSGAWPDKPAAEVTGPRRNVKPRPAKEAPFVAKARWIWNTTGAEKAAPGGRTFLRSTLELESLPASAVAAVSCDNEFTLWVNGKRAGHGDSWHEPVTIDLKPLLVAGKNVLAVEAINWPDKETGKGLSSTSPNPAGFVMQTLLSWPQKQVVLGSDATWLASAKHAAGWEKPEFDSQGWTHAVELGDLDLAPWKIQSALAGAIAAAPGSSPEAKLLARSALMNDDPLSRAMGRPNREQIVTRRDTIATTLQLLELTNGETLDALLRRGAARWLGEARTSAELSRSIYRRGLLREPTSAEQAAAVELLGEKPATDSVQDLLWVLAMLPEFQLVY